MCYLDVEADIASCLDDRCLGCTGGFDRIASAAHLYHVLLLELAVDRGFFAIVTIGVGVITFGRSDISLKC